MWKETVVVSVNAKPIIHLEAVSDTAWNLMVFVFVRDSNPAAPE
jgi:hypothetical protein